MIFDQLSSNCLQLSATYCKLSANFIKEEKQDEKMPELPERIS